MNIRELVSNARAAMALVILLAALVLSIGGLWVAHSVIEVTWLEAEAKQTEREALERRQRIVSQPGRAAAAVNIDPFFEGTSFALAANAMQRRVVSAIEQVGGTLITVGIDPQTTGDDDQSRRVVVQAVAEMNLTSLQELLWRLESAPPLMFVENVSAARVASRDAEESEDSTAPARLAVNLRLTGYFRGGAK